MKEIPHMGFQDLHVYALETRLLLSKLFWLGQRS